MAMATVVGKEVISFQEIMANPGSDGFLAHTQMDRRPDLLSRIQMDNPLFKKTDP